MESAKGVSLCLYNEIYSLAPNFLLTYCHLNDEKALLTPPISWCMIVQMWPDAVNIINIFPLEGKVIWKHFRIKEEFQSLLTWASFLHTMNEIMQLSKQISF